MEILHFEDLGDTSVISECSLGDNLINSHDKLTKSEIRSSSSRFEHCSESLI